MKATVRAGMVWRTLGFLGVMAVLGGGCVSLKDHNELLREHRICQNDRERLRGDLATIAVDKQRLQGDLGKIESELDKKNRMMARLNLQAKEAQEALKELTDIYRTLVESQRIEPIVVHMLPPELQNALKEFAERHPKMAQYDSERGVLKFGSDVVFDLGSDDVKPAAAETLAELAEIVNSAAAADFDVMIVGHTDNVPIRRPQTLEKHPTNWHLSVHRAIAVMKVLRGAGTTEERLGVMGYGEFRPIESNVGRRGNPNNRRVEVFLVPKHAAVRSSGAAAPAEPVTEEK